MLNPALTDFDEKEAPTSAWALNSGLKLAVADLKQVGARVDTCEERSPICLARDSPRER